MERNKLILGAVVVVGVLGVAWAFLSRDTVEEGGVAGVTCSSVPACQKLCDQGNQEACGQLGGLLAAPDAGKESIDKAAVVLEKACGAGSLGACVNLGALYHRGLGVEKDPAKAVTLYDKACSGGFPPGCHNLGVVLLGGDSGVPRDVARAIAALDKACQARLQPACDDLKRFRSEDAGVPDGGLYRDDEELEVSCGKGAFKDCAELAQRTASGDTPNPEAAAELYDKACKGGYLPACTQLGMARAGGLGAKKDAKAAVELFRKACDGKDKLGCDALAGAYLAGEGVEADPKKAIDMYQSSCDGGYGPSCTSLGTAYAKGTGVEADIKKAEALWQKGCDNDDVAGCDSLGNWLVEGRPEKDRDHAAALKLFTKACDKDYYPSCVHAGMLHHAGKGTSKDEDKAKELWLKACKGGEQMGCDALEPPVLDGGVAADGAVPPDAPPP